MISRRLCVSAFTFFVGFSVPCDAFAQSQEAAQFPEGEIVVTATRNESLASRTPIALTAVSGESLLSGGITNPTALADQVPNLSFDRNAGGLQITIRGVTSSDVTEKGDPSAAFMADGIYIARAQAQEVSFFDIQRVEVLRGPQGTLFGRNTTAGLINIITNKPKFERFSGSFDAAYGNFDTQQITGVINVPISETIAIRAAANYDRRDSYLIAGPAWTAPLDPFKKNISGRLSALFDLGAGELLLRGDYSSIKGSPANSLLTSNFYSNFDTPGVDPIYVGTANARRLRTVSPSFTGSIGRDNNTWGIVADLGYDLGPVTVNYLGSYREFKRRENDAYVLGGLGAVFPFRFNGDYWQNSQELRLSTNGDGPLKAQAGLYYFKEKSAVDLSVFGLISPTPGTFGYVYGFPQDPTISESWAGFGQATYTIAERFRLTGGIRYSNDKKSRDGFTIFCGTITCDEPGDAKIPNVANRTFSKVTWRVGADFDVDERTLLYGVVATGYKAGGFNDGCETGTSAVCSQPAEALYYEPETLTSYEVGLKTQFLNNAVRLNASVFHYDYEKIQLSQTSTICGGPCNITTNAAAAKVDGVELEGVIAPARSSKFDFSVAWLNARYAEFFPAPGFDWSGKKLDRSPTLAVTAGYTQTFELGNGGNFQAGVRTRVSDSYQLAALNTQNQFRVPSYSKTDLLIAYNAPDNRWYAQAFVKNLENSIVVSSAASGAIGTVQIADPRTYGGRVGVKF
ncbi:TonB-dependent receptor [Sphingobium sp. CR2-8]|uniref:TonB-dependent receptor n=1 Tax=Sphingobium sp. CR2-8 TaxID=1306534 RepID=UPI002DB60B33|nr:TonB-dependent receptor [Sphingobium sp. CR2-8]MEC3909484.1 TonB-dependent receptor [Sphingobium sp. CR2-8]